MKTLMALSTATLVAATPVSFAQDRSHPDFGSIAKTATPTLENSIPPAGQSTARGAGSVTAAAKLNAPYPPQKLGCHHLENGQWHEVPCVTDEYMREHPTPRLTSGSIQSTPKLLPGAGPAAPWTSFAFPYVWGLISILWVSDPTKATETDSHDNAANLFSIQNNTNVFTCTKCSDGVPFGQVSGVPNSASQKGDQGWVQFAYQSNGGLCVWTVDWTITKATNNTPFKPGVDGGYANAGAPGYHKDCSSMPAATKLLTGPGAPNQSSTVVGYVTCPPDDSTNLNCTLGIIGLLPWFGSSVEFSVQVIDVLGLSGQWTNINGSILGGGYGSQAIFTNTKLEQQLSAYSCVNILNNIYIVPEPCSLPKELSGVIGSRYMLSAAPGSFSNTGETNNLTNDPASFLCQESSCFLHFNLVAQ